MDKTRIAEVISDIVGHLVELAALTDDKDCIADVIAAFDCASEALKETYERCES